MSEDNINRHLHCIFRFYSHSYSLYFFSFVLFQPTFFWYVFKICNRFIRLNVTTVTELLTSLSISFDGLLIAGLFIREVQYGLRKDTLMKQYCIWEFGIRVLGSRFYRKKVTSWATCLSHIFEFTDYILIVFKSFISNCHSNPYFQYIN